MNMKSMIAVVVIYGICVVAFLGTFVWIATTSR
jgi:hypothetical protein